VKDSDISVKIKGKDVGCRELIQKLQD